MGADLSSCSRFDTFNPDNYVSFPTVTREDVLRLHAMFEYFHPENGIVDLFELPDSSHAS